jgi:PilZ domain
MAGDKLIQQNEYCRRIDDDSADNILELLLDFQKKDPLPEIRFLNFYKEVPIFSPASITYAFDETLSCRTADIQCRAIAAAGSTIIQSAVLRHDVLAKAVYQPNTSEVIVSDFCYSDRRTSVRVKMDSLFQIMIEAGPGQFNGKLRELSLNGCAVDIADPQLLGNYKFFYLNLDMPFKTFKGTNRSRIMVKLVRGTEIARGYRCIFIFEHDNTTEDQIGRLLTQRQTEIIRELK